MKGEEEGEGPFIGEINEGVCQFTAKEESKLKQGGLTAVLRVLLGT